MAGKALTSVVRRSSPENADVGSSGEDLALCPNHQCPERGLLCRRHGVSQVSDELLAEQIQRRIRQRQYPEGTKGLEAHLFIHRIASPGLLLLVLPLSVGQAPATAECLVQANMGEETVAANLRRRVLRRVELLLGFEHLEVIGQPLAIAIRRMLDGLLERLHGRVLSRLGLVQLAQRGEGDRKSTRLNSSHLVISYAVFCLKKKKK